MLAPTLVRSEVFKLVRLDLKGKSPMLVRLDLTSAGKIDDKAEFRKRMNDNPLYSDIHMCTYGGLHQEGERMRSTTFTGLRLMTSVRL